MYNQVPCRTEVMNIVEANKKYGRLTTQYVSGKTKNRNLIWHCVCECGNEIDVSTGSLSSGNTKSCGCLHKDSLREYGKSHRKLNKYDLSGEYGIGYTSKGETFLFDKEDYNLIKPYTWHLNPDGYVISMPFGKQIRMHILIMNSPEGKDVDHINHDVADNRKHNLRICEHYQNIINTKAYSNNTSGRKGVSWDKNRNKWAASICINKKKIHLGRFENFNDAVKVREEAEAKYHKEFTPIVGIKNEYKS